MSALSTAIAQAEYRALGIRHSVNTLLEVVEKKESAASQVMRRTQTTIESLEKLRAEVMEITKAVSIRREKRPREDVRERDPKRQQVAEQRAWLAGVEERAGHALGEFQAERNAHLAVGRGRKHDAHTRQDLAAPGDVDVSDEWLQSLAREAGISGVTLRALQAPHRAIEVDCEGVFHALLWFRHGSAEIERVGVFSVNEEAANPWQQPEAVVFQEITEQAMITLCELHGASPRTVVAALIEHLARYTTLFQDKCAICKAVIAPDVLELSLPYLRGIPGKPDRKSVV